MSNSETSNTKAKDFIGYEYKEVSIKHSLESIYIDGYTNFGWTIEDERFDLQPGKITLKMKRDRKIRNKAELVRLQRKFEAEIDEIDALEQSKFIKASIAAYIIGIVGTAFMAGSVFAIVGDEPNIMLCIILAIPGFIGWIIPYFVFRSTVKSKTAEVTPLIDSKYDEIYEVCEEANRLSK